MPLPKCSALTRSPEQRISTAKIVLTWDRILTQHWVLGPISIMVPVLWRNNSNLATRVNRIRIHLGQRIEALSQLLWKRRVLETRTQAQEWATKGDHQCQVQIWQKCKAMLALKATRSQVCYRPCLSQNSLSNRQSRRCHNSTNKKPNCLQWIAPKELEAEKTDQILTTKHNSISIRSVLT